MSINRCLSLSSLDKPSLRDLKRWLRKQGVTLSTRPQTGRTDIRASLENRETQRTQEKCHVTLLSSPHFPLLCPPT